MRVIAEHRDADFVFADWRDVGLRTGTPVDFHVPGPGFDGEVLLARKPVSGTCGFFQAAPSRDTRAGTVCPNDPTCGKNFVARTDTVAPEFSHGRVPKKSSSRILRR